MDLESGKLSQPLTVADPDDPEVKYQLQPSMRMELASKMKQGGEPNAMAYLRSLGKTPKEQILFMAAQFSWPEDKKEAFLDSLED